MTDHLYEIVRERAARHPDSAAIGGQDGLAWRTLDGRALLAAVDAVAEDLRRLGVGSGDRVVLWLPNGWRAPVYYWACWKIGAVVVPFDRETNPEAAARIVAATEPRLVVLGYDERPAWARGLASAVEWWTPSVEGVPTGGWQRPPEPLAALFFTSGTTGAPKGCEITHANLLSQLAVLGRHIPLGPGCRLTSVLPLSHLLELTCGLLYPIAAGAAVHYAPSRRGADVLRVLQEQRVTHMIGVPQLLDLMGRAVEQRMRERMPAWAVRATLAASERLPLPARRWLPPLRAVHARLGGHLRMLASGGAALAPATRQLWERLGVRVVEGYGTSECSPVVACGASDGSTPVGYVGRPIEGVEVKLAGDGEIVVRGPNVMRGYWRDPERTAEVLRDGWYQTGDLGALDAAGNLRVTGRARDLIVLPSGVKVWPSDVEGVLRDDPAVGDAAVVAVPTPSGGVKLHAYLLPSGAPVALGPIVAGANARLAQHQRVARASWWPEADFPRTTTMKVRRNLLGLPADAPPDQTLEVGAPGDAAAGDESCHGADDAVALAVAAAARLDRVPEGRTLAELGVDSLATVELVAALEATTGRRLRDDALRADMTLADLRAALAAAPEAEEDADDGVDEAEGPLWPYTWGRVFRSLAAPIDLIYRLRVPRTIVLGGEHLAGLPSPVVLAGNHHSFADAGLLRAALRTTAARGLVNRLAVAALGEAIGWRSPASAYGVLALGLCPLQQQRGRGASMRHLVRVARAGNAVLIFPQGRHSRVADEQSDPPRVRFKTGAAHVARALDAPVVPFGLAGTEAAMPPSLEGHRGLAVAGIPVRVARVPLAIAFGTPLRQRADETAGDFTLRLERECYALAANAEAALACAGGAR